MTTEDYPYTYFLNLSRIAIRKQREKKARERIRDNPEAIYEKDVAGAAQLDPYGVFKPSELLAQDETRSPIQPKFSPGAIQILRLAALDLDTLAGPILTEEDIISPSSSNMSSEHSEPSKKIP